MKGENDMKKAVKLAAFMLVSVMLVMTLVSCSSYGKIEKNFKDAGYTEVELDETANKIVAELEEGSISCTAHLWKTESAVLDIIPVYALVLEFGSEGDIDKAIEESGTISGMIEDVKKSELVRDNCLLVPFSLTKLEEMKEIFNK